MKSKENKIYTIFSALIIIAIMLVCIWNISALFIPVQLLIIYLVWSLGVRLTLNLFDILLVILVVYEIFNLCFSLYPANSILYLFELLTVIYSLFVIRIMLEMNRFKFFLLILISSIALCMGLFNLFIFYFKYYESIIYGFNDFTQFRYLYKPMGILSNEWVTVLLCFLPFPTIGYFLSTGKYEDDTFKCFNFQMVKYLFLISLLIIAFNIFVSFSRAAYFSFLLWIVAMNAFFYFFRLIKVRTQLLINISLILCAVILLFVFSNSIHSTLYPTNSHIRSIESRYTQWSNALQILKQSPFIGVGSKNYPLISSKWQDIKYDNNFSGRINNSYLQILVEKGIVGFILWSILIVYLIFVLVWKIKLSINKKNLLINSIILSTLFAILVRELFFSSVFCNSGILFFFLIPSSLIQFKQIPFISCNRIQRNMFLCIFGILLLLYFLITYSINDYNKYIDTPDYKRNYSFLSFDIVNNSLWYAAKGLKCERNSALQIDWRNIVTNKLFYRYDIDLSHAIEWYEIACSKNSYDATFYHNLSWLYYLTNQSEKAMMYINKAIDYSYNTSLFHISKGLMLEYNDFDSALCEYETAIMLSPDITETDFFIDFESRNPKFVLYLLNNVYTKLSILQSLSYSSIIEAKRGKILFSLGKFDQSYEVLNSVTIVHPNLNRPWYYLGLIDYYNGNNDAMIAHINKSLFLNTSDYLPLYAMATYYNEIKNYKNAEKYKSLATKKWFHKLSIHASRSTRIYYLNTNSDDIIPKGLLDYTSPKFRLEYDRN